MPRFIDVEQGSSEWLELRKKSITATDIATIMGVNPYKTPYQLWQEKLGLKESDAENDAMRRGKSLEPIALESFCILKRQDYKSAVVVDDVYTWAMASLDGYSQTTGRICEIKCMGKANHEEAMNGIVKPLYMYQMHWQMFVTELFECDYFVYSEDSHNIISVKRDQHLINQMIPAAEKFLECLDTLTPPALTDRDYVDRSDDPYLEELFNAYQFSNSQLKELEKQCASYKDAIVKYCGDQSTLCNLGKITKVTTKGRVQYDNIPELEGVDLERYRGKEIVSYRITTKD